MRSLCWKCNFRANFGVLPLGFHVKALIPQGFTGSPNYFGFLNNLMTLIICESLREIGEVACVTSAWSSRGQTLNTRAAQLTTYLLKRGYSRNVVTKQIRRAADVPCRLALQTKDVNKPKRVPFITTFNPSLPHISNIIKKHYNLLLSSDRCKNVFQHLPVVAFRRSPNLRDLLVTDKISSNSSNPQLPSGFFRCGKNCATCPYISHGLTTYTFFSTGETHPIKSNLTCETKNLIYMTQCNRCNLQYIGETKRRLKDRFNEHRRTIDSPNSKSKPTTAAENFLSSPNHTANNMQLLPIEKVFSNRDSIRKAREAFLIQKGRTIDPDDLNIREETY